MFISKALKVSIEKFGPDTLSNLKGRINSIEQTTFF